MTASLIDIKEQCKQEHNHLCSSELAELKSLGSNHVFVLKSCLICINNLSRTQSEKKNCDRNP